MSKNRDKMTMSVSSIDDKAARRLAMLETWARRRAGTALAAREAVAKAVGVSAGALERVRRGRVKGVRGYVAARIQNAFVEAIQKEIRGLEHELFLALARGCDPEGDEAEATCVALRKARELIGEAKRAEG